MTAPQIRWLKNRKFFCLGCEKTRLNKKTIRSSSSSSSIPFVLHSRVILGEHARWALGERVQKIRLGARCARFVKLSPDLEIRATVLVLALAVILDLTLFGAVLGEAFGAELEFALFVGFVLGTEGIGALVVGTYATLGASTGSEQHDASSGVHGSVVILDHALELAWEDHGRLLLLSRRHHFIWRHLLLLLLVPCVCVMDGITTKNHPHPVRLFGWIQPS
jgi:hypothetical protein